MDLKALAKDLAALQARLEKYEDLLLSSDMEESGLQHCQEMVGYYRVEVTKVRAKYLELMNTVQDKLSNE